MTTEEHLNRIVAKCRENLAIAEKRTPGKWKYNGRVVKPEKGFDIADCWQGHVANATFIASCAGPAEAGWRATIAAIELCDRLDSIHEANDIRVAIIAAWPEELL